VPDDSPAYSDLESEPEVHRERVQRATMRNRLERRKTEFALEEVEDQFQTKARQARTQQEEEQRRAQDVADKAKKENWERNLIERALNALPRDCSAEYAPVVASAVRTHLKQFGPSDSDRVIQKIVEGATESALKPYHLQKRREIATDKALAELPYMRHGEPEIKAEAKKLAAKALDEIGDSDQETLNSVAKLAMKPVKLACEISRKRAEIMDTLQWQTLGMSKEEKEEAQKAVTGTLDSLPTNTRPDQMQEAADKALAAQQQRFTARRAEQERVLAEQRAVQALVQLGLQHLDSALNEYEWDSYWERLAECNRMRPLLQAALSEAAEDGEIDSSNIRKWVGEWVEEELDPEENEI